MKTPTHYSSMKVNQNMLFFNSSHVSSASYSSLFCFVFLFWATPGSSQELILALDSEITSDWLEGHMGCQGFNPGWS